MPKSPSRVRFTEEQDPEDAPPLKKRRTLTLKASEEELIPVPSRHRKARHPLGVLPSGNILFASTPEYRDIRSCGLGLLAVLPDPILILLLSSFDATTLLVFGSLSRGCFAYACHEPLWKDLVISKAKGMLSNWLGSWRRTYIRSIGHPMETHPWPTENIQTPGIYSDELFQPTLCAHTSLIPFFFPHPTRPRSTIARRDANTLTADIFADLYARPSKPVLIFNALSNWPAQQDNLWTMDNLESRFAEVSFRAEAFDIPFKAYRAYADDCDEEDSPLYLFDSRFVEKTGGVMGDEYQSLEFFGKDLFELLGPERPNYRWLIAGPARSGSTFHKDPNGTSAWNAVLTGRKGWVMFPPQVCPPGVFTNDDESEVTSPLSIPEWFLTYFDYAWKTFGPSAKDPALRGSMVIGVCGPGEVVYVPSGWWHLVVNLEESVAVTQNFVSKCELEDVLRFMRDKPDQMSGFKGGVSGEEVYRRFTIALEKHTPEVLAEISATLVHPGCSASVPESVWDRVVSGGKSDEGNATPSSTGFAFAFDLGDAEFE